MNCRPKDPQLLWLVAKTVGDSPDSLQNRVFFLTRDVVRNPSVFVQLGCVSCTTQFGDRRTCTLGRYCQVNGAVEGDDWREYRWQRLRAERFRWVKRRRKQAANGEGRSERFRVGNCQREGHDAALRKAGDEGFAKGGAYGDQCGEGSGDPIGFLRHEGRRDVFSDRGIPNVHPAVWMAVREDPTGPTTIALEHLQQARWIAAHGVQRDDHGHSLVGSRSARHVLEIPHALDFTLRCAFRFFRGQRRDGLGRRLFR